MQKITREAEHGRRTVDKFVRVHLKKGGEMWVLIHIEVQGQRDSGFAKRVFICNCRIFDRYDLPVASLVILSDPHSGWRPDEFGYSVFGSEMKLSFPVVKLLDFGKNESRLRHSDNPFAIVTLVIDLLRFIDWELTLPQNMERELRETIRKESKEMGKPYVSSWERMAMQEAIIKVAKVRFGALPADIIELIGGINDPEILEELLEHAARCESLDAFAEHLPATV